MTVGPGEMARANEKAMEMGERTLEVGRTKAEPPVQVTAGVLDNHAGLDEKLARAGEVVGVVGEGHRRTLFVSTPE